MPDLIQEKSIEIETGSGGTRTYLISKFPAIEGREIVSKYPISAMPGKLGDYEVNKETMFKLMSYVAVPQETGALRLTTPALINNHVPDWETLAKIEMASMEYNCSFFLNGKASTLLGVLAKKLPELISKILTDSLAQSLPTIKPASTNSEPSTP